MQRGVRLCMHGSRGHFESQTSSPQARFVYVQLTVYRCAYAVADLNACSLGLQRY
jgi:hypothetical protein